MDQERKWEETAAAPESVQEPVPVPDAEEPAVEAAPESVQEPASESAGHSPDGSLNREEESFSPPGDAWEESRAVQQEPQAGDGEPSDSAAFPQTAAQEDEWGTPPPAPVQDREPFSAAGQGDGGDGGDSGVQEEPIVPGDLPDLIYAQKGITIQPKPEGDPLSAVELYDRSVDSVVGVTAQYDGETSLGSGIVLTQDGYIVTNAHVVLNTSESIVTVKLHDGTEYPAIVIGYEEDSDLAVLRVEAQGLQPAEFGDASELKVGEEVFAIGNPGGDRYGGTLTGGYVSGLNRELEKSAANGLTYIQTDAAINPGNSGGALFNAYGQVVGINSNKVVSTSYEGIGFAIPISEVSNIISDLMTKGYVSGRGRLGITARTVTELQAEASGIPTGVLIVSVDDDSPLKGIAFAGDVITEAAGEKISSLEDLYAVLRTHGGGESITVTIYSAGTADTKSSEEQYTIVLLEDRGETQAG